MLDQYWRYILWQYSNNNTNTISCANIGVILNQCPILISLKQYNFNIGRTLSTCRSTNITVLMLTQYWTKYWTNIKDVSCIEYHRQHYLPNIAPMSNNDIIRLQKFQYWANIVDTTFSQYRRTYVDPILRWILGQHWKYIAHGILQTTLSAQYWTNV